LTTIEPDDRSAGERRIDVKPRGAEIVGRHD
jgi:hypothetical protein